MFPSALYIYWYSLRVLSSFRLITYFPGLVYFHTSRSEECWRASGILPKEEELESSEKHWNTPHSQSRFNRIGIEQHEKWKTRFEKQILLYIAKIRRISYWLWQTICFWPRQMYDPCRHLNATYKAFLLAVLNVKHHKVLNCNTRIYKEAIKIFVTFYACLLVLLEMNGWRDSRAKNIAGENRWLIY